MKPVIRCGDHGGINQRGEPCGRRVKAEGLLCPNCDGRAHTCGDAGGIHYETGEPCSRLTKVGTRCADHGPEAEARWAEVKRKFLDLWGSGECTLRKAAVMAKTSSVTIWKLRKRDPEFDAACTAAEVQKDEIQLAMIEDSNFSRMLRGKAPASLVIFTMINICRRSQNPAIRSRWLDLKHVFNTDVPIDYEKLGKDALMRIRAGESPMDVVLDEMERFAREQETAA